MTRSDTNLKTYIKHIGTQILKKTLLYIIYVIERGTFKPTNTCVRDGSGILTDGWEGSFETEILYSQTADTADSPTGACGGTL